MLQLGALVAVASGRRIRVRPVGGGEALEAAPQQVEYYAEQEDDQGPVLVSRQDTYGRANGQSRLQPKLKPEAARAPPVQTIRNYNKLNDDGSFTFGYEAADGSFKEETRGTDCVVRGKYGYVDPDGNKREFSYVSGNPCDPNAVQEEETPEADSGEENVPQNIPRRPVAKPRPVSRPTTTLYQQDYNRGSEEDSSEEERPRQQQAQPAPRPQHITPRPSYTRQFPIPTFAQLEEEIRPQVLRATPRPKAVVLSAAPRQQQVNITPRPSNPEPPPTTYRPQLVQVTSAKPHRPTPTAATESAPLSFEQELKNFQLEHNVVSSPRTPPAPKKPATNQPIYTSELVFDPSSGQYNTVVYQQLPQTSGDFSLRGRLQPYVAPQQYYNPRQAYLAPQRPPLHPQQQLFQHQQAALVQQSGQLFAQQQQKKLQQKPQLLPQSLLQQEPQRFSQNPKPFVPSQPFYYVAPGNDRGGLASGQIDAFLKGHSIAF
jgi:hypothetical protein